MCRLLGPVIRLPGRGKIYLNDSAASIHPAGLTSGNSPKESSNRLLVRVQNLQLIRNVAVNRTRTSNILLIVGFVVLFAGAFLMILVPASLPLLLTAVAIRRGPPSRRSQNLRMLAAVLFAALAVLGFYIMYTTWGTMEYGLIGYITAFGPFVLSIIAITFLLIYFIDRSRSYDGDHR